MNTEKIKNDVELIYAIIDMDTETMETVTNSVFRVNNCVKDVFQRLMKDEETLNHYSMCFQIINSDTYALFLSNIVSPSILNQDLASYIRKHEVSSELDSEQIEFMTRLLFHLGIVICKHNLIHRRVQVKNVKSQEATFGTPTLGTPNGTPNAAGRRRQRQAEDILQNKERSASASASALAPQRGVKDEDDSIRNLEERISALEKNMKNPTLMRRDGQTSKKVRWKDLNVSRSPPPPRRKRY